MHRLRNLTPLVFEYPGFRWLWLARVVSQVGDIAGYVAMMLLVRELSGSSGAALAGLAVAQGLPVLLVGPFAGVVADRFQRNHVLIASDLMNAALYLALPFATTTWQVYAVALLARLALTFFNPARAALLPDLLPKSRLVAANAFMQATFSAMLIVGPAVGAMLVAAFGYTAAFWFNAASFALSAVFASRIVAPKPATQAHESLRHAAEAVRRDLAEGWRALATSRALKTLFTVELFMVAGMVSFDVLEVLFIKDVLGATDAQYGAVITAAGVGGVLAGLTLPRLTRRWRDATLWAMFAALFAFSFFPYANTRLYGLVLVMVLMQMFAWIGYSALQASLLQRLVPDAVRGRIFGLAETMAGGTRMTIVVVFGVLVDSLGIVTVFNLAGLIVTLGAVVALLRARRLQDAADDQAGVAVSIAEPAA